MSGISFKKGDRAVHHSGNRYHVLGVSNQDSNRPGFPATVVYCREGTDATDDVNWYTRSLAEFQEKFTKYDPASATVDGAIKVTLGVFGQINRNNQIFILDRDRIEKRLQQMLGKSVGEMAFPKAAESETPESWLGRITTVVAENESGTLLDYDIIDSPRSEAGTVGVITVTGVVSPSKALQAYIDGGAQPYFGIRSLTLPQTKNTTNGVVELQHITDLVCFDLTPENPRVEFLSL